MCQFFKVQRSSEFETTGKWCIEIQSKETGATTTELFDAVLICSGKFAEMNVPHIEGEELFKGELKHSRYYKSHDDHENKRIVIMGMKNTGCDIAAELSGLNNQVT